MRSPPGPVLSLLLYLAFIGILARPELKQVTHASARATDTDLKSFTSFNSSRLKLTFTHPALSSACGHLMLSV